ncbi:hypothetical protein JMJ77_0011460 [Colletotrichum scovillei]|uniref:Uncharacterized protein n=1 Tax=Colletotrichum scovillei TaxID=1209932 RepID=A0A9P7QQB8_9PEZI|nr:hypothetical protein JMJ78_0008152 [Colletotrichum scovillei]KAG7040598.1 hypothetical protein JMJ77_0011460 [Colletotrichum scovillei]KAG7060647.1 hypothetical protein JMJ76_0012218 [Colletotrichum scovillei]
MVTGENSGCGMRPRVLKRLGALKKKRSGGSCLGEFISTTRIDAWECPKRDSLTMREASGPVGSAARHDGIHTP